MMVMAMEVSLQVPLDMSSNSIYRRLWRYANGAL